MAAGLKRTSLSVLSALVVSGLLFTACVPVASAQLQYVSVSHGVINLGMADSINVTAPAAGNYVVVVVMPDNSKAQLAYSFTAAGQVVSEVFGNASLGFKTAVTQVGTYNVFLEQGSQVVSATSFYATNKLNVWMDFVNGGLCEYIAGAERGVKIFPRFYVTYASNGAPLPKSSSAFVTFSLPDKTLVNASYHKPTAEAPFPYGFYIGKFYPNWNYSQVGPWSPTATISDGLGNTATFNYTGPAFEITPAQLSTSVQLIDNKTSQAAGGLYNGQTLTILATVTYPSNPEPVPGFVGVLNSTRGGSVTALVGWGFYNSTSGTFGSGTNPGGLIGKVPMSYTGSNGTWKGTLSVSNLPSISAGSSYEVIVTSKDGASPANTGFALVNAPPATVVSTQSSNSAGNSSSTASGGITLTLALMTAVGTLIVGLIVGIIVRPFREATER
jgi:hypothetical protein